MIDLTGHVEPDDMPLCPLCDNAILEWDGVVLVSCGGAKGLAHSDCVAEITEDEEDEYEESA